MSTELSGLWCDTYATTHYKFNFLLLKTFQNMQLLNQAAVKAAKYLNFFQVSSYRYYSKTVKSLSSLKCLMYSIKLFYRISLNNYIFKNQHTNNCNKKTWLRNNSLLKILHNDCDNKYIVHGVSQGQDCRHIRLLMLLEQSLYSLFLFILFNKIIKYIHKT